MSQYFIFCLEKISTLKSVWFNHMDHVVNHVKCWKIRDLKDKWNIWEDEDIQVVYQVPFIYSISLQYLILCLCLPTSFPRRCHVCCKLTWSSVCFSLSFIFTQICLSSISFLFPRKLTASHVYPPIAFEMKGKHTEMEKWFQTLLLENLEF